VGGGKIYGEFSQGGWKKVVGQSQQNKVSGREGGNQEGLAPGTCYRKSATTKQEKRGISRGKVKKTLGRGRGGGNTRGDRPLVTKLGKRRPQEPEPKKCNQREKLGKVFQTGKKKNREAFLKKGQLGEQHG